MGLHPATWLLIVDWGIRLLALALIPARHPPAAARSWLLLVGFVPLLGLPLYLLLSRPWLAPSRLARQAQASTAIRAAVAPPASTTETLPTGHADLMRLVQRLGDLPPCTGNRIELLPDYSAAIDDLVAGIDSAQRTVHLLYYLIGDDDYGNRVLAALRRAATRGVRCRLLADAMASRALLRSQSRDLRQAGIDVRAMMADRLWANAGRVDLRNHRKLATVDGHCGWIGSQNLVDPHFVRSAPNVELVARVHGPIVAQLEAVFASDWFIETGERIDVELLPEDQRPEGSACAQLLPSGPAYPFENARDTLAALIQGARRELILCTPYFVPDEAVLRALCLAALAGIDVRLIVSGCSNQLVAAWAQRAYYDEVLRSGARIHRFPAGFLHAKHVSVDASVGMIGSINLDVRSFALNSELGMLVYDRDSVAQLRAVQADYLEHSDELTLMQWRSRPAWHRSIEGLARLADVLL